MKMIQLENDEGDCEVVIGKVVRSVWCMYVGLSWGPFFWVIWVDGHVTEGMGYTYGEQWYEVRAVDLRFEAIEITFFTRSTWVESLFSFFLLVAHTSMHTENNTIRLQW
jgi:hypothetical protein